MPDEAKLGTYIFRDSTDPFARVPKSALDDPLLSMKAKGVLAYLLSKPPHWKVNVTDICSHCTDGERAIRSGIMELREVGYAKLERQCDEKQKIVGWLLFIADTPKYKNPDVRNAHLQNAHVQNSYHSKIEDSKNECSKKEKNISPVTTFTKFWFRTHPGYKLTPVDGVRLKQFFKVTGISPEEAWAVYSRALTSNKWHCTHRTKTISSFVTAYNEIVAELGPLPPPDTRPSDDEVIKQMRGCRSV